MFENALTKASGKSIALRLAEDGFDVCINDIAANKAGIDEVSIYHSFIPSRFGSRDAL